MKLDTYGFQHISESYNDAIKIIDGYRTGTIKPLVTPYNKLNMLLGGGFHKSTTYVIGGRPGTGKSALCNRIIFGICDLAEVPVLVLYWNFEMPNYQQVIRELGAKENLTVNEIRSSQQKLALENFNKIKDLKKLFSEYPIYLNCVSTTPERISHITSKVADEHPESHILNIIDHSRLVTSQNKIREERLITKLLSVNRYLAVEKGTTNIILSQLNRNIESKNRMASIGPVPQGSDYFGSDAVQQTANVAFILQRPEMYTGLNSYLNYPMDKLQNILFLHFTKNRDGDVKYIPFVHDLAHNQIKETTLKN